MSDDTTGGHAFPQTVRNWNDSTSGLEQRGMSLRDWFAGQALSGMFHALHERAFMACDPAAVASRTYEIADAMLAARSAPSSANPAKPEE